MKSTKHSGPLDRAFHLLDVVASAGRDLSLVEIVTASGLPQSSTFRLANNLVECGMLRFDKNLKIYSLGPRARRLAFFLMGKQELKTLVAPVLERLTVTFHETSFFVRREVGGVKLVSYVIPEEGARSFIHPGLEFPAHATATGKAIHSFETEGDHIFDIHGHLEKYQESTIQDPARLEEVYADIRRKGYAISDSEIDKRTFSIAAPVFMRSEVVGAIGVVGPDDRLKQLMPQDDAGAIMKKAASEITTFLNAFDLRNGG